MRKSLGAVVLATAALVPGVAQGSEVSLSDPSSYGSRSLVAYGADNGETNNLTVSLNGSQVILNDPGATITTSTPLRCTISNANHTAVCTPTGASPPVPAATIDLEDLNDTLVNNGNFPPAAGNDFFDFFTGFFASGGSGADNLTGGPGQDELAGGTGSDILRGLGGSDSLTDFGDFTNPPSEGVGADHLFGGDGSDFLSAGGGNDEVRGEGGDDVISGGSGTNTLDGGPGIDLAFWNGPPGNITATTQGIVVTLNAAAATTGNGLSGQNDTVLGVEDVEGTDAADQLTGSAVGNILQGFSGNDTIVGGAGNDNVQGGGDADNLNTVDNEVDRADCGGQVDDKASVENIDQVLNCITPANITTVTAAGPPGPVIIREPVDRTKPVIGKLSATKKPSARSMRRNGKYAFTFTSGDPKTQSNVVVGTLTGQVKGNVGISTAGELQFAQKRRTVKGSTRTKVTLVVPKKLRRALKKGKKLRLLIQLTDAAGNTSTRRVALKLAK